MFFSLQTLTLWKTGNLSEFTSYWEKKMERFRFMEWTCPRSSYIISSFPACSQPNTFYPAERSIWKNQHHFSISHIFPCCGQHSGAGASLRKKNKSTTFGAETWTELMISLNVGDILTGKMATPATISRRNVRLGFVHREGAAKTPVLTAKMPPSRFHAEMQISSQWRQTEPGLNDKNPTKPSACVTEIYQIYCWPR